MSAERPTQKPNKRLGPQKSYAAKSKDLLRRPERRNASGNLIAPEGQKNFSNAKALPQHAIHLERLLPELLRFDQPADRVVSRYFDLNAFQFATWSKREKTPRCGTSYNEKPPRMALERLLP